MFPPNVIQLPFGKVYYPDGIDEKIVIASALKMMHENEIRNNSSIVKKVNLQDINTTSSKVGLFLYTRDFSSVVGQSFSAKTPVSSFGQHKDFFKSLPEMFDKNRDYQDYPRGFVFRESEYGLFFVVGGSWLGESQLEKNKQEFCIPDEAILNVVHTPFYDVYAEGDNAGKPIIFE